jgi:hypothetical protein
MKKTIVAVLFVLAACTYADVSKAKKYAEEFARDIPGTTAVKCNSSDGDGYVSCTVFRGEQEPIALSCGAQNWCACNCAEGCKLTPTRPLAAE